jgi:hypothetical protein
VISRRPRTFCSRACRVCLAIFDVADIREQCISIKFCFKLGKTFTETHEMMKNSYGDQCMSRTRCYEWFKCFKDGRQSAHDGQRLGRPWTSCDDTHVAQFREIGRSNRRLTVREIAEECNVRIWSCHDIPTTKLEIHRVVPKFVPWLLTQVQRHVLRLSANGRTALDIVKFLRNRCVSYIHERKVYNTWEV